MRSDHALPIRAKRRGLVRLGLAACVGALVLAPAAAEVTHGPPRVRNVYIPADELKILFDAPGKGVLMPRAKVLALWEEARRRAPAAASAPADAVLSQAAYEAQLDDHELRIHGRIQIATLRAGWQTIDLPLGGLAVESARLGGQPARFGRKDDGALFLVLEQEGRFELELEMSAPLASKEGDLAATLRLPPVAASELAIRLAKGKQLRVGETAMQGEPAGQQTLFRVAVGRGGLVPLVVSESSAAGNRAPLVLVQTHAVGRIEPAGLRWEVALDLDVYARAAETFRLQVPRSVDLAEVEAPELARWTSRQPADGQTSVTLTFRKPFLGRRAVRLLGLAAVPSAAAWDFPTVKVLEAAAHAGQVAVVPSPALRVDVGTLVGIRPERLPPTDATGTPPTDATPLSFAFWDEGFRLPLRVHDRRRTVQASVATLVEIDRAGAALRGSLTVQPRHAPLFDAQVQLPRGWEVTSVLAANRPVDWEPAPAGVGPAAEAAMQTIRFDLAAPLAPGKSLEIAVTARQRPDRWLEHDEKFRELPLPDLRLVGADEVEGTLLVQAPPDIELLAADLSDDLQPVAAEGPRGAAAEVRGTALQYRYRDDARKTGRLQVRMRPARVSAETLAFVRLDRGKLDVHYEADLHIRQGTLRHLRFTLPAEAGEKVQIVPVDSPARIIEQRRSPAPVAKGKADGYLWEVVLDRPVTGDLTLALDFGRTLAAAAPGPAPADGAPAAGPGTRVAVPVLALLNVSRQSGMVAVEAADDQQIGCTAENLRDLDPADVRKPRAYAPSHRIVAAYQYQRLPYGLAISATRHAAGSVLTGICESAEIISIAEREGRMRHQARFRLRSLNLPHVPVVLPQGADLWSATLDGRPVEVRRKQGAYMVPLAAGQTAATDAGRELTLLYETRGPSFDVSGLRGRLWPQVIRQSAPEIGVTTLGTTWHIHPPDGAELVSVGGDFQPETPLTRPALAARLAEMIAQESTSGLPWKATGFIAAFVLAGFFALLWSAKGCTVNVFEILVVVGIIAVLIALLLPATQSARESARRATCVNNLKQIGLALHNYLDVHKQFPAAAIGPANVPRERQFSWLVALLPYMECGDLYKKLRLDLPIDDPHNAALLHAPVTVFLCPSDASRTTEEGLCKTSFVAITGADSTRGTGSTRGIMGLDRGLRLDEITDGTSNTLIVGEVTDGGPWFAAGRGTARRIDDWIGKKQWSHHPGVGNFVFADGGVRSIPEDTDPQSLRDIATAQGGDPGSEFFGYHYDSDHEKSAPESAAKPLVEAPATPAEKPAEQPEAKPAEKSEDKTAEKTEEAKAPIAGDTATLVKPKPAAGPATVEPPAPKAPPPPPVPEAPPAPKTPPPRIDGQRARLSLGIALETRGGQPVRLRREGGPGQLEFGVQDRAFAQALQACMIAAALVAAWIARRRPGAERVIAIGVGLAVPIGLSGLVPLVWTPLVDGVLLGALAAACLWTIPLLVKLFAMSVAEPPQRTLILAVALLSAAAACTAAEPGKAPRPAPAATRTPDLTLMIPYDPAKDKPLERTQVYLPHDEFLRLWKQAHPDEPARAAPGVAAVVSHAEYSGRLQNDVARFDGRILVHQLADQWTRTALPLGKVAFETIAVDGRPAALAADSGERPAIYLDKAGPHVVDVRFGVPVSRLGATGQMSVPLRSVSSGRLMFALPEEHLEVQVGGSSGGWRRQTAAAGPDAAAEPGGESVVIPLGGGELSIRWQPRRVEARQRQLVSVDQALLIEVHDAGVYFRSRFHYRIQQGAVRELPLRIPPGLAIQAVRGAEVADWSIETEPAAGARPAGQRLVVSLKAERSTGTDLEIDAFRSDRRTTGPIDVQSLEPLGVVRETGRVAVACEGPFRVRAGQMDHLDQIDRTGLDLPHGAGEGCTLLAAYRYTLRPWRLMLEVERDRPRVEVSDRTAVAVAARQAVLRSLLTARVTGGAVRSLGLRLPAALRVTQVRVPPGADWFLDRDDQGRRLRVELREPTVGTLELAVSGTVSRDAQAAEFAVPGVIVEDAAPQRGQLAIYLDDDLQAVLAADGGARSIDPSAVDAALRAGDNRPAQYAFQYDAPPKDLRLRLSSAASRANGDVTTVVSVREGAVTYVSRVDFEIRQAGRSRFRVTAPLWLGDDVELRGEQIRQVRSEAAAGRRTWDVELQQPLRGKYPLYLVQTLPLPGDGVVRAAVVRPLDVERCRAYLVLENGTADEIVATTSRGATPVPIAEVPEGLTDAVRRQAVAAYRVAGDDAEQVWQRRAREQETALTACINMVDLTTVLHADGRYRARAVYNIRNFTLQFLELELPAESQVWSVHVSGQPVRPATVRRQGRVVTLLPLQKMSAGDFSSKVEVIYSGDLGAPLGLWTQVRPPAPQVLSEIPVARTLWTVHLPREYAVSLAGDSNLDEVAAAYQQEERKLSFLNELRQILQVASVKSGSAARSKAQSNLKQVGVALDDYASQTAEAGAKNAADVQAQARQIAAEVKHLEELKTEVKRTDDETFYFKQPPREPEGAETGTDLDRRLERLPSLRPADDGKPAAKETAPTGDRPDAHRGDLRKQAADQLSKLQKGGGEATVVAPRGGKLELGEVQAPGGGGGGEGGGGGGGGVAAAAGQLPLDLELTLVGTAHHFSKLHGDPRLVLGARHEKLARGLAAVVWAGLCLALAAVLIRVLKRPDALVRLRRGWPWLAAFAGAAWLFLLPAGIVGFGLLVIALCVLVDHSRKRQAAEGP